MCEFCGRLVAWIDGEVDAGEAAEIERHVKACAECRSCLAEFRRVSGEFAAYCEAVLKSEERVQRIAWVPLRWAAVMACAAGLILAVLVRHDTGTQKQSFRAAVATDSPKPLSARVTESEPAPLTSGHRTRRHAVEAHAKPLAACCAPAKAAMESANWVSAEPSVQIAIPAAAMFPPGAMPDGMTFVADLSISADGSARQVLLQPQVFESQKRGSKP